MSEYDLSDTVRYRLLSNGAVYDNESHRIVGILPRDQGGVRFDSDSARAAVAKRRERAEREARRGIQDGTGADSVWGGVRTMSAAMARLAASGQGLASVKAYESVMRSSGLSSPAGGSSPAESGLSVSASVEALQEVRSIIESLRAMRDNGGGADGVSGDSAGGGGRVDA